MKSTLVLLLLLVTCAVQAATEVIELRYRLADELLPAAQAVLGGDGKASTYGQKLVVNAPPEKIHELRELLKQLDTRPRRLLISVDRGQSEQGALNDFAVDGTISGGNAEIKIGQGEINGRDQVRIIRSTSAGGSSRVQQIQTNEGYAADSRRAERAHTKQLDGRLRQYPSRNQLPRPQSRHVRHRQRQRRPSVFGHQQPKRPPKRRWANPNRASRHARFRQTRPVD